MAEKENEKQFSVELVDNSQPKWTIGKYFKSIAHYKWWIIGFSLGGFLFGLFGVKYLINPGKACLSASFTYSLAGRSTDNGDTIIFIDGTSFNVHDLSSEEYLSAVQKSKESFKDIDVKKLVSSNAFTVNKNVEYYNEDDPGSAYATYSVESNTNIFPNVSVGKEFIYAVINMPKEKSTIAINNYQAVSYFAPNFEAFSFEKQIKQIENQYVSNANVYVTLEQTFASSTVASKEGARLSELYNLYVSKYYTSSLQSFDQELLATINEKKFVNFEVGKESEAISQLEEKCAKYIEAINDHNKNIAIYQQALDTLLSTTTEQREGVAQKIAEYTKEITDIKLYINEMEKELANIGYFLDNDPSSPTYGQYIEDTSCENSSLYKLKHFDPTWVEACQNFKAKLISIKEGLEDDRKTATETYRYCYASYKNRVNVLGGGYVSQGGDYNTTLTAIIGLVGLFLVSSLICSAIYVYGGEKKEEK